jgi:hypothetical protein
LLTYLCLSCRSVILWRPRPPWIYVSRQIDRTPMTCPFCEAEHPELVSLFGSQLLLSQYRCRACGTYFEGVREAQHVEQEVEEVADGHPGTEF